MQKSNFGYTNSICGGSAAVLKNFRIYDDSVYFAVTANSIMISLLTSAFDKIIPSGILQHLSEHHSWIMDKKFEATADTGPRIFTFDDLSFGFAVWLGACGISLVGFIMEILVDRLMRSFGSVFGLIVVLTFLNSRQGSL